MSGERTETIDMATISNEELQAILRLVDQGKAIITATKDGTTVTYR